MIYAWRVVLDDGAVRNVSVDVYLQSPGVPHAPDDWYVVGDSRGPTQRTTVLRYALTRGWEVAEVLAPGVVSRGEVRADLLRRMESWGASRRSHVADAVTLAYEQVVELLRVEREVSRE